MSILQTKLDFLLEKYAVDVKAVIADDNARVTVDGESYALLPWRLERRFIELRKIVDTTVGAISHFKTMTLNPKGISLDYILKREMDTAEFVGGLKITEIFEAKNENTASVICATDKGAVITLELDATLPEGCEVIDKHEMITDRGTACDRVVDSQTPLASVYVYGKEKREYTDVDFELYGLSVYEISVVRSAFEIAKNKALGEANNAIDARLEMLLAEAAESEAKCENIRV